MRIIATLSSLIITIGLLTITSCESLFEEYDYDRVYLYAVAPGTVGGNFGGRTGADNICANDLASNHPGIAVDNVHALLNVSAEDEIRDMPKNYSVPEDVQIIHFNGFVIANDWADLLDGTINASLYGAGVYGSDVYTHWTGDAGGNGVLNGSNNCAGWTSNSSGLNGIVGAANTSASGWLSNAVRTCNNNQMLLCIAW